MIQARISEGGVITEASNDARELFNKSRFGTLKKSQVLLSFFEAMYLLEKGKITINDKKELTEDAFVKKASKKINNFLTKFAVFRDLRERGYVVKTALKFGEEFRVYDKGINPGEDHAKWVVYPVNESNIMTWHDFAAKNRVAHSTKKNLLIGIVDDEEDITYYEISWKRP
jgi:tRNA-intron endonuclease